MTGGGRIVNVDGVQFEFPDRVTFCKFDELPEYQRSAGVFEHKGCDLVVVDEHTLWLVEVKDYDHSGRTESEPRAGDLAKIVGQKVLGTMACLYQWQRTNDDTEAASIARQAMDATKICVVLHIEPKSAGHGTPKRQKRRKSILPSYVQSLKNLVNRGALKVEGAYIATNGAHYANRDLPWISRRDPDTRNRQNTPSKVDID